MMATPPRAVLPSIATTVWYNTASTGQHFGALWRPLTIIGLS